MTNFADIVQPYIEKNIIPGVVLLAATKDRVIAHEAFGFANLATKQPMALDSYFWIASMTKPITATALSMLISEGKISLDDPVEQHLPEYKDQMVIAYKDDNTTLLKRPKHPVTVREILSHTSGLPFAVPFEKPTYDRLTLAESVRLYGTTALQTEPGTKYAYSNAGTNTAGRLIEVISGQAYEDFLQERIFDPLGMTETTFWPSEEQLKRLVQPYKFNETKTELVPASISQLEYPLSNRKRTPMPAGGLFSVATDCAKFCQMILQGGKFGGKRLIPEAAVKTMIAKQTGDLVPDKYGLCFSTLPDGAYGHGGALTTTMFIEPKLGLIRIVLMQHYGGFPADEGNKLGEQFAAAAAKLV